MGDHDDGALEVQQEVLQPVHRVDVQVVGGLVHHQQVGIAEQGLGQQDLHLQPGVQGGHVVIVELGADAKALEDAAGVALGLPAAQLGVLLLQLAGPHAVLVGHLLLGVDGLLLLADVIQALVAHDDRVHDVVGVVGVLVLLQNRHAHVGQDGHLAGAGLQFPGEDLQKGGLAGAVGADDAVAVAPQKLQVHVGEERGAAVVQAQIGDRDHGKLLFSIQSKNRVVKRRECVQRPSYHIPSGLNRGERKKSAAFFHKNSAFLVRKAELWPILSQFRGAGRAAHHAKSLWSITAPSARVAVRSPAQAPWTMPMPWARAA